jgi:sulfur transfer protein SufE
VIEIIKYCDFYELRKEIWSGAVDTVNTIFEGRKENELMELLADIFYEPTDITKINDFLWFDRDYILESLGIDETITEGRSL